MKITLLNYTKDAAEMLIMSKKTRLRMSANVFDEVKAMSAEEKLKELEYVFGTIGSSWEFVDYTFLIEGVTRAFTHQLVRHRVGVAFAQQSQRSVGVEGFEYLATGMCIADEDYFAGMGEIKHRYSNMINKGIAAQDARGILPTNVLTNIMMKMNLRALADMMSTRLCIRAQDEFRDVVDAIKSVVISVHPFVEPLMSASCAKHGFCPFKNFKECPVKQAGLIKDIDAETSGLIKSLLKKEKSVQGKEDRS